jgi:hypothetical protein
MGTFHPFPGTNIDPVGDALKKYREAVIAIQHIEPQRMAGDLDTIASGLLAMHLVMDRIIAARVEMRIDAAE